MVIGASTERPVIFPFVLLNGQIVDAGDPPSHQALFVELPILVAIATKPVARIVVPFICKAHGYAVVAKCPDLLDQSILQLANPLAYEERLNSLAAANELGAVAPDAIHRIGKRYFGRIARVPGILGEARLLRGAFRCKGRQRWAGHGRSLLVSDWPLAGRCSWASDQLRYVATSKMTSNSTGVPRGRLATPYTRRQGLLSFPKTSLSNSEAASATFGCSRTSPEVATDTPSRTIRVTLSSDPKCRRA